MREIAFDTETTGLDPAQGHRIVELGCVEMMGKIRTGNSFHTHINPERDMPPEAERIHGLSAKFLYDKPVFAQIVEGFLDFVGDSPLIIHNAGFDLKFINFELQRLGFPPIPVSRTVDTVSIARRKFPGAPASLDALCRRYEIDLSMRTKHGALLDAELLADVYLELCGGRQSIISFETEMVETLTVTETLTVVQATFPRRHFAVPDEELAAHRAFLATLKDAMWLKQAG